jgi:hypothetical protein
MAFLSGYTKRWKITVDNTQVPSTQSDFPVYLDLSLLPDSFWTTVAEGGGDIRMTRSDGETECARDVVSCVYQVVTVTEILTGSSNWVCPSGVSSVQVEAWGGGAAGGGRTGSNGQGGGGGGGAYSKLNTYAVTPSSSYAYVAGAGVTGGSTTGPNGNDSYWVDTLTLLAKGGTGGGSNASANTATGGGGGQASAGVGDVKYDGGNGANGISTYGGGGGSGAGSTGNGNNGSTSTGGAAKDEGGAGGNGSTGNTNGIAGSTYGGGGGGGRRTSGTRNGGNGAAGAIRLTYQQTLGSPLKQGEVHFKANSISGSSDTDFYIYANGTSADYAVTDTYGRNAVWSDYAVVYHTETNANDSTSNGRNGTVVSATFGSGGKIANRIDITPAANSGINITGYDMPTGAAAKSFTFWANLDALRREWFVAGGTDSANNAFGLFLNGGSGVDNLVFFANGGANDIDYGTGQLTTATWTKITITYDGTNVRYYKNGSLINTTARTLNTTNTSAGTLVGNRKTDEANSRYDGKLDEVRFMNGSWSTDWETTEYNNQNSPATFYTIGAMEEEGGGGGVNSGFFAFF